jgi:hypothetical protein
MDWVGRCCVGVGVRGVVVAGEFILEVEFGVG